MKAVSKHHIMDADTKEFETVRGLDLLPNLQRSHPKGPLKRGPTTHNFLIHHNPKNL